MNDDVTEEAANEIPSGETPAGEPFVLPPTPLGFRIVRSLMLLASAIVLVFALPVIAWQATTVARERVEVDGAAYEFAVTRRVTCVVHVTDPAGEVSRYEVVDEEGREPPGEVAIDVEEAGRTVLVTVGDQERRFEFANGAFEPVPPTGSGVGSGRG